VHPSIQRTDRHLLAQLPIKAIDSAGCIGLGSGSNATHRRTAFAAVLNADGDVIGGGPIDDHTLQIPHFPEFAHRLIRRLDAE